MTVNRIGASKNLHCYFTVAYCGGNLSKSNSSAHFRKARQRSLASAHATGKSMRAPLFSSFSHSLPRSHTLSNSRHRIKAVAPTPLSPHPPSPSHGCKHYPSNGSLEDTKTSSYLTPDTNFRALTTVYLGIKHTHIHTHQAT